MIFMQSAGGDLIIIIYSRLVVSSKVHLCNFKIKKEKENNNEKLGKRRQFSINNHFVFCGFFSTWLVFQLQCAEKDK